MTAFPVLIGDIGGTNARFALLPEPDAPPIPLARLPTAGFRSPLEAIEEALGGHPARPRGMMLAVAAAVAGPVVVLTNANWVCNVDALRRALGLSRAVLINDFVPVAAALEALHDSPGALRSIGPALPGIGNARVVLGPGTGLGAAASLPCGVAQRIVSTEAGHVSFGPADEREAALFARCREAGTRLTSETLISGPGLARLYRAVCEEAGEPQGPVEASTVTELAAGRDACALEAVAFAARLLGRFAGDLALIFGARGGVYIAGGVAQRIASAIDSEFRPAFEDKAPLVAFVEAVPTFLVTDPDPALTGLHALVNAGERFIYDRAVSV